MAQWCSPTKQGEAERTSGVKRQQHISKESCIWYSVFQRSLVYDKKNSESVDELLDESLNNHNDSPVDPIASLKNNPLRWTRKTTTNCEDSFVKKQIWVVDIIPVVFAIRISDKTQPSECKRVSN